MNGDSYPVDPARLAAGQWSHQHNRQIGEGDISASYSGDAIALRGRTRKPFVWQRQLWVCVGMSRDDVTAYRLTPLSLFEGAATTYAEKTRDSEAARADPQGFYHGMSVQNGGQPYVLTGPPVRFMAGQVDQLDLFSTRTETDHMSVPSGIG